ncbi:MAG: hypothetical protein V1701_05765 [Planctomycetota bacterium]
MLTRIAIMLAGLFILASSAFATTTAVWNLSSEEDLNKGALEGVIVSSDGEISAGLPVKRFESGEISIWTAIADKNGKFYFGTGNSGKLLSMVDGALKEVFATGELVITSLAFDNKDNLYIGTIPDGKIFVLNKAGEGKLLCKLPEIYIWALLWGKDGYLYAGTGPEGKIYRIKPDGAIEVYYDSKEDHIMSLVMDDAQNLYAGTSFNGIIFRVSPERKMEVLFGFEENEIRSMQIVKDTLYLGTNKARRFEPQKFVRRLKQTAEKIKAGEEVTESPFQELFDGALYQYNLKDNTLYNLFRLAKTYITNIAVEENGAIFLGTGDEGKVYRFIPNQSTALVFDFQENQAATLALYKGQLGALGTSNAGSVYLVDQKAGTEKNYTSEVKDTKFLSRWGSLNWSAKGELSFQTRSGNTAKPDETWSDWSAPAKVPGDKIASPMGRYLQFRASWNRDNQAVLRWIKISYLIENQRPIIDSFSTEGLDTNASYLGRPKESGELSFNWKAKDPDGDELLAYIYYQKDGTEDWVLINKEGPVSKTSYKWDTSQVDDGWYQIKLVISDEKMNPADRGQKVWKITKPILVDNRKPVIAELAITKDLVCQGSAEDSFSNIARIEYAVDGKNWQLAYPSDGLFDDKTEQFSIKLDNLAKGRHFIAIKAYDTSGNFVVRQEGFEVK